MQGQNFEDHEVAGVAIESLRDRVCRVTNHVFRPCIIKSDGRFKLTFDFFHFITILATLIFTPIQVLFKPTIFQGNQSIPLFYILVDVIFAISMFMSCISSCRYRGIEVKEFVELLTIYSKTHLALDFILLLPYDFISGAQLTPLYRLIRVIYVFGYFTSWLRFTAINHLILRSLRLVVILIVLVHWLSCAFSFVLTSEAADSSSYGHWLPEISVEELLSNDRYRYLVGCYWGFNGIMGHLSTYPHTNSQISLTFFMNVVGLIAHALVFSSVASMVHHVFADTCAFTELISSVNAEMQTLKLPHEMQTRIRSYFMYHNERFNQKKESGLMSRLPPYLQMELSIHLNSEIITNVPFFAHADQSFALQLSKVMTLQVCLPGEYIIRQGDIGTEMYFLTSGSVEVSTGDTVHKVLTSGQFFGEMALIEKSRRTANVKAVSYCDFLVLCKRDLDTVLEDCPEIKRSMVTIVHNRKISNSFHSKNRAYSLGHLVSEQLAVKKAKDEMQITQVNNDSTMSIHSNGRTPDGSAANKITELQQCISSESQGLESTHHLTQHLEPTVNSAPETIESNSECISKSGRRVLRPLPLDRHRQ